MDSKSVKVAVVGGESERATAMEMIKNMDGVEVVSKEEDADKVVKVEAATMYGQMPVLDKSMLDAESDYRSDRDTKSQRLLNDMYTGKHRASTMYGITKGHKSNTSFKANRNKNFQRTKH